LLSDGNYTHSSARRIAPGASCCYLTCGVGPSACGAPERANGVIFLSVLTTSLIFLSVLTTFGSVLSWFNWSKTIGRRREAAEVPGIGAST
jgi:hypothetical protein